MKRSNLILLGALGAIFVFMTALQVRMKGYVKGEVQRDYGNFVKSTREVSEFKAIAVSDGIKVEFEQTPKTTITIEARENLMSFVRTEIIEETLIIEKAKKMRGKDSVKVFVSNAQLDSLRVSSGSSFTTLGMVSGGDLKLVFRGESEGDLELNYESVQCSFSSDSEVNLTGDSKKIKFSK
ncbi:GIN domain-containing protein [Ulvibacterium sp.]|uniref:GIN domain-containing protein n=1 Tax=Ulvibacterium sp. TaxID=2665914 RepID=UPI003BA8C721